MPDIFHHFLIHAPTAQVFKNISSPSGLDEWWTETSSGIPIAGEVYTLSFGPQYSWKAIVSKCTPGHEFEFTMREAHSDWLDTRVGFHLNESDSNTEVHFYHVGWKESNEHYRISNFCWAMYLRILKRFTECGEQVAYADRLNA
jgi:uncharacterized protein YndB with AHSA1/START domain